jgi:hypothetical protein
MDARERFLKRMANLQDYAQDHACPIYAIDDTYGALEGSGFLVDVADQTLLITAAHVFYIRHEHPLFIPGAGKPEPFGGNALYTGSRELVPDPDYGWDLAVMRLDKDSVHRCSGCPRLTPTDLAADDIPAPQTLYGFTGFPGDANPTRSERSLPRHAHYYGGQPVGPEAYQQGDINPETHFLMTFDHAGMVDRQGNVVPVPEPHGMSGGPVWRLGSFDEVAADRAHPQVIGLTIWWLPQLRMLAALRISLVVSAIRNAFPDLAPHFSSPTYVAANVTLA